MTSLAERDQNSPTESTGRSRFRGVLALLAVVVGLGMFATACMPDDAGTNFGRVNEVRAGVGLPSLTRSAELDAKAQVQADKMAKRGSIFHSASLSSGVSAGWSQIGENVAVAGTVQDAQAALEASPGHYENMTNGSYTQMGVGVTTRNGRVFVVQVYVAR